jgi:hypothetical protein
MSASRHVCFGSRRAIRCSQLPTLAPEQKGRRELQEGKSVFVNLVSPPVRVYANINYRAGDAAHSFPPTGGLGLNSGLADVHNLAYKLNAVLKGHAADSLLDTYQSERRHVAVVNAMQSVKNGKAIFALLKTMGIGEDLKQARTNMFSALQDPGKRAEIDEGIEQQREHFDNVS